MITLHGVTSATGPLHSASFIVQGEATILLPGSYGGDSLDLDDAVGHVQVLLPDGTWVDYADGLGGELISEAGAKIVHAPGLELRVSFVGADGDTDIPVLLVHGMVSAGRYPASNAT